jgi:hypothetical protein
MHSFTLKKLSESLLHFRKWLMVYDLADKPFKLLNYTKQDFAWIWCTGQDA